MISAQDALARLQAGNRRFVAETRCPDATRSQVHSNRQVTDQRPFAVILGCSDSRVPIEIVFDQGFGDLFVIRVAGNIVAPSQVGSVEFAAELFNTQLVVGLGHTHCGAVCAALDEVQHKSVYSSQNIRAIVSRIRPSVEGLVLTGYEQDRAVLMQQAVRANVRVAVDHLRHGSAILEGLIGKKKLQVVGAEYSLETGEVDFFDGV